MKVIPNQDSQEPKLHTYQESVNHIGKIFSSIPFGFDEKCICSVTYEIQNCKVVGAKVAYNKICIQSANDQVIYWPMQVYWENTDPEKIEGLLNKKE